MLPCAAFENACRNTLVGTAPICADGRALRSGIGASLRNRVSERKLAWLLLGSTPRARAW
jgi:hypothetical protein